MQVQAIAKIFSTTPKIYIELCRHVAHDGPEGEWLRKLNRKSRVGRGSHMPVYPFPEIEEELQANADTPATAPPAYNDTFDTVEPSGAPLSLQQTTASARA
jgi:hypothetical protein